MTRGVEDPAFTSEERKRERWGRGKKECVRENESLGFNSVLNELKPSDSLSLSLPTMQGKNNYCN
jgi:hypothetical protein